ncbi:hypothetical protein Tco_0303820 [Tanacetum coccineum]
MVELIASRLLIPVLPIMIDEVWSHHQNSGEAGVSKDISGSKLLAPSLCSGIKGQHDKGDEGLCFRGTKLNSIFIIAEVTFIKLK